MDYLKDMAKYGLSGTARRLKGTPPTPKSSIGRVDYLNVSDEFSQRIRLIPGAYEMQRYDDETGSLDLVTLPFYECERHFIPARRERRGAIITCSAGPDPTAPKPCLPCDELEYFQLHRVVFSIVELEQFHRTPWIKKGTTDPTLGKDGKPILIDALCEDLEGGGNCSMCRSEDDKFFGKSMYWELSNDQFDQLLALEEQFLRTKCVCGKDMRIKKFECSRCAEVIIQMSSTKFTKKELRHYIKNGMVCPACKSLVRLIPIMDCSCEKSQSLNLFMVDLNVSRRPSTTGKKSYTLDVTFSAPCEPDKRYGGSWDSIDLAAVLAPPTIPEQRKICGLRRGAVAGKDNPYHEDYGKNKNQEPEAPTDNKGSFNG